jgi:uncharacterized protein YcaQ
MTWTWVSDQLAFPSEASGPRRQTGGRALRESITPAELATITLDNHFLLWKPLPEEVTEAVSQICGLNAQTARSPYLSLWNRIEAFTKPALTEALYEEKTLIKAWLMRGTVHIVPTVDFPIYQRALRRTLCEGWRRSLEQQTRFTLPRNWNSLLDAIANSLSEGPLTREKLLARVKGLIKGRPTAEQKRLVGWALRSLTYDGVVCHDRPLGPWYHFKENRFALVSSWLDPARLDAPDEIQAGHDLLIKYLGGYGPATLQDFAYWAGIRMGLAREIHEHARGRLCEVALKGSSTTYWALKEQCDSLEDREKRPAVFFLPEFDPLIMGHKDKTRIMDEADRKRVFRRLGTVVPTMLVDGRVAGTWDYSFGDRALEVKPFGRPSKSMLEEIERASSRLVAFNEE